MPKNMPKNMPRNMKKRELYTEPCARCVQVQQRYTTFLYRLIDKEIIPSLVSACMCMYKITLPCHKETSECFIYKEETVGYSTKGKARLHCKGNLDEAKGKARLHRKGNVDESKHTIIIPVAGTAVCETQYSTKIVSFYYETASMIVPRTFEYDSSVIAALFAKELFECEDVIVFPETKHDTLRRKDIEEAFYTPTHDASFTSLLQQAIEVTPVPCEDMLLRA